MSPRSPTPRATVKKMFTCYVRSLLEPEWLILWALIFMLFSYQTRKRRFLSGIRKQAILMTDLFAGIIMCSASSLGEAKEKFLILFGIWTPIFLFPPPFIQYVSDAVQPLSFGNSRYARLFRVIHAPEFLRSFASDRSHMKDPEGNWIQLPPQYEPIVAEDGTTNNLNEYIMMSVEDVADIESMANDVYYNKHGVVLNETILPKFFAQLPGPHT